MFGAIARFVGAKVITAMLVVASAAVLIWYWRLAPAEKAAIWIIVQGGVVWISFAAALPWALFFVPPMVLRTESNAVSAVMLIGYLLIDVAAALWLAGWRVGGALAWAVLVVGFLCAGVYNSLVCEYLASRAEDNL